MKKYIYFLIPVYALYIFGMFYVMLPPLNWHAPAFWKFLALSAGPLLVLLIVFSFTKRQIDSFQDFMGPKAFFQAFNFYHLLQTSFPSS